MQCASEPPFGPRDHEADWHSAPQGVEGGLLEGGEEPCAIARKTFGRIAIANSDASAYAYTDAAIDQGHRAVEELTART